MVIQSDTDQPLSLWGKLVLLIGANLTLVSGAGLTAAMPAIFATFADVPGAEFWVSMIITLPALFVVIGGPVTGMLVDRVGRKPVLAASILLSGIAGSGAFFLNNIFAILVTRALVGLSIAGAMTATNALIADYFSGQQRAKFMGYNSAFLGLGVVLFLPLGGFLADISWQHTFLSYLGVLLFFVPALFAIREPAISKAVVSDAQAAKFSINRTQKIIYAGIFVLQFTFITIPVFQAFFLAEILAVGALTVGLVGGFSGLMTFLGGMSYERIGRQRSFHNMMLFGFLIFGSGFICMGLARTWVLIILGTILVGFGLGLSAANLTTWLAHEVDPAMRGRANGLFTTLRFMAEFLGALVFTPITNATSFSFGYLLSAIVVLAMALVSLMFRKPSDPRWGV